MSKRTKQFARSNPSPANRHLVEKYTALHEGRKPDKQMREKLPPPPKWYIELGPVPEFTYLKKTPDGVHPYRHEFAEWAQPTLVRDNRGKLGIVDQEALDVTDAGIEDKLTMKHRSSIARMNPSHGGSRYLSTRHNPFNATAIKKAAIASGVVGLGSALTVIGLVKLFSSVQMLGNLSGYSSAAAKAGIGLAGSLLVQGLAGAPAGKTNAADIVAASLGIGGVSAGVLQAWGTYMTPASVPMNAAQIAAEITRLQALHPSAGAYRRAA